MIASGAVGVVVDACGDAGERQTREGRERNAVFGEFHAQIRAVLTWQHPNQSRNQSENHGAQHEKIAGVVRVVSRLKRTVVRCKALAVHCVV